MGQEASKRKSPAIVGEQHQEPLNGHPTSATPASTQQTTPDDIPEETTCVNPDAGEHKGSKEDGQLHKTNGDSSKLGAGKAQRRHKKGSTSSQSAQTNGSSNPQKRRSFYETVDASEVLPYLLIGNLPSAKDEDFLQRKNVKFVLNLTSEPSEDQVEGVEYKNVLLEDDEDTELVPHLEECFEFIDKAKASCSKKYTATVLVHSYYGISRTSAVVLAYLMRERQWTLKEAHEHLKERHPLANPNDGFVIQLLRYDQELHDGKMSMTLKDFYHQL